jgi:hypothetical protein
MTITQNDYGIDLVNSFTNNGIAINLTGCTINIDIVYPDNTKHSFDGTITDAVNGIVEYVLISENTTQEGLYKMYFSVLDSNALITAQNLITYYVIAKDGGVD